jgi:hypothetical protein
VRFLHIKELIIETHLLLAKFPQRQFVWQSRIANVARFGH